MYKTTGKIYQILPEQTGSKRGGGEWTKQEFVIETSGDKPEKIPFFQWDKLINVKEGDIVEVQFSIQAREWNGKWFTNLLADEVLKIGGEEKEESLPEPPKFDDPGEFAMAEFESSGYGDLPF